MDVSISRVESCTASNLVWGRDRMRPSQQNIIDRKNQRLPSLDVILPFRAPLHLEERHSLAWIASKTTLQFERMSSLGSVSYPVGAV
jgi:hypothetical protein